MSQEQEVQNAHDLFYTALNRALIGDPSAMAEAWWHDDPITAMHPIGGCATGWEQVWLTWQELAASISEGRVEVTDLRIHVLGQVAYTVGIEHVSSFFAGEWVHFDSRVTNIFLCKEGVWKMLHHHVDKAPGLQTAAQA
ncbi:MAG TPA: nuclear transport factor 2 family protein [Polyangiaceae bacterium]|nr:nuclear transport factor 2 family protein [Polyangiaceae bacterium]